MNSRGPDDTGIWSSPDHEVVLGSSRLAIIDLSPGGHMPMEDPAGRCCITYNGELYNYRRLREELARGGHLFRSTSDTEVVLAAYMRWGQDCLQRLRGMFAFAIADLRGREPLLLLARDRLGIKPLYWTRTPKGILFASEVRALLASGWVEKVADHQAVWDYLGSGSVPGPRTIIQDVFSVEPGHAMTIRGQKVEQRRYWVPTRSADSVPSSLPEAARALRQLLRTTVAEHMEADVPVGAFLSGGVDSASIVALASEMSNHPLQTFTVRFGEGPNAAADVAHAGVVARRFRTDHTEVLVSGDDVASEFKQIVRAMDQPSIDGVNTYFVSKAARAGVTVSLSGLGADEVLAGYAHFRRFRTFDRLLPNGSAILRPFADATSGRRPRRFSQMLEFAAASPAQRHAQLRRPLTERERRVLLVNPPVSDSLVDICLQRSGNHRSAAEDSVFSTSVAELSGYLTNTLLRDVDAMSMAHSLEVRVPYLDHQFVEFALALPGNIKLGRRLGKVVLRQAMADLLPSGMLIPGKAGFSMPLDEWVAGPLSQRVTASLRSGAGRELFDEAEVRMLETDVHAGRSGRAWAAAVLAEWLDAHDVST